MNVENILNTISEYVPEESDSTKLDISMLVRAYEEKMMLNNMVELDEKSRMYTFTCPHCHMWTEVPIDQVNCHIFRHGFFFQLLPNNNLILLQQMDPHASKEVCDTLKNQNKIIGCGRPFKFVRGDNNYRVEICDYI
mgnify:CR=1 FL=1